MRSETSHVRIFRGSPIFGKDDFSDLVATIRLGKAQSVREWKRRHRTKTSEVERGKDRP
jgi:hypothetical protein